MRNLLFSIGTKQSLNRFASYLYQRSVRSCNMAANLNESDNVKTETSGEILEEKVVYINIQVIPESEMHFGRKRGRPINIIVVTYCIAKYG